MFRSLSLTMVLVCGAFGLACNDPTSTQPSAGPAFRTENNPNGPGAFVIRFDDVFGLFFSGPDEQYSVIAGLTPDQLAALCAGEDFTFEPARAQLVFRPDGSVHQVFRARNVTVFVFQGAFADFCAELPFAVGRGSFINTDNDLFVSGRRTNSFGFRLRGRVTDGSGDTHHVLVKFHALITRSGVFREISSEIKVN